MTATAPTASVRDDVVYLPEISPTASVSTSDAEFVVDVATPGFHADELRVELIRRSLHVVGHAPRRDGLLRPHFEFWFVLPPRADEDSIEAVFDGALRIRAPLSGAPVERVIAIQAPSSSATRS
jgi:HSP20 family molecular chaperone IbpA